jgi:hypothetical protein
LAGECGENSPECVFSSSSSSSSHLFFSMWPLLIMNFDSILVDSTGNLAPDPRGSQLLDCLKILLAGPYP